ncbi:hypothetical protein Dimus_036020, partial [Dionaea muscipula]
MAGDIAAMPGVKDKRDCRMAKHEQSCAAGMQAAVPRSADAEQHTELKRVFVAFVVVRR